MNDNNREYISIGANSQPQANPIIKLRKRSLFSVMLKVIAVVLILFIVVLFAAGIEEIDREEGELLQYGTEQYSEIFGSSSAPDDNILFVFLLDDEEFGYSSSMGIVGDNVNGYIHIMFEEYEDYYDLVEDLLDNTSADYFSECYAEVIDDMTDSIMAHGFYSSFDAPSDRSNLVPSGIINKTKLDLNDGYIAAALNRFTEETEIPCTLLIEYEQNVYSDVETTLDNIGIALVILLMFLGPATIIVAIITFLKSVGGKQTDGERPVSPRTAMGGFAEKCGKDGCDGKVDAGEKPPWEFD